MIPKGLTKKQRDVIILSERGLCDREIARLTKLKNPDTSGRVVVNRMRQRARRRIKAAVKTFAGLESVESIIRAMLVAAEARVSFRDTAGPFNSKKSGVSNNA